MRQIKILLITSLIIFLGSIAVNVPAKSRSLEESGLLRVYEVNKKVNDFPEKEDFSTPENAYATINRLSASGEQGFWRRVSEKKLAARMSVQEGKRKVSKTAEYEWLNANITEVRIFEDKFAGVYAKLPSEGKTRIDARYLAFEDGQWKNSGNDIFSDMEEARKKFEIMCGNRVERPKRKKIDNPEEYLKTYVEFLKDNAEEPKAFVMKALTNHKIVIIGETHHRPMYWAFNCSLASDPEFSKHVGAIYMELPSNDQELIDRFLARDKCDKELVIKMLRDMLWMGWPDQPMLDFFVAVWKANQNLKPEQKLRIVLVDMERPWDKIQNRDDWRQYDTDRDKYMAEKIINDIQSHPDEKRNRLFIVGVGHTALNFELSYFGGVPLKSAGWYLREKLGNDNVYAFIQHRCVQTNSGNVSGRLCLGLFDSAFAVLDNKPMAFTLEQGPFGEQMYDGQPDRPVWSKFRDGFNAYLYLGPLENEIFSPLIDGFYTDKFVKELERRHRMMYGKGWAEAYRRDKSDAQSFIEWMSNGWGKAQEWRENLGPIDAWKYGDDWEDQIREAKHIYAFEHPEVIKSAAKQLIDAIRNADYERFYDGSDWPHFLPDGVSYQVDHYFDIWVQWVCKTFKDNPIKSVELGEVSKDRNGLPAIPYKVSLQDGRELKGVLPFKYMPRWELWMGVEGIDWHLQYAEPTEKKEEKKAGTIETKAEQTL